MKIRLATEADWPAIWQILQPIAAAGETYALPRDIQQEQAQKIWLRQPRCTYVVEHAVVNTAGCSLKHTEIVGSYYLKTNQAGPGEHVCNCGYVVSPPARGRGLATAMCQHSQVQAITLGYRAMQFNFVASSNNAAIALWKKLGFTVVGCLPWAFHHPHQGDIDALIMYKWLASSA